MPDRIHNARNHGLFDDLVLPVALKVMLRAGDPISLPGIIDVTCEDNCPQIITTPHQLHIELLSPDDHLPDFLAKVKGVKTGKQFIELKPKRPLYLRNVKGGESTVQQMSTITRPNGGKIVTTRLRIKPV